MSRSRTALFLFVSALVAATLGKQVIVHPRHDVYVERARPTWSYRTAILQVGKADGELSSLSLAALSPISLRSAMTAHVLINEGPSQDFAFASIRACIF